MKTLVLTHEPYSIVVGSFRNWLDILGYAPSTVESLPNHIQEFLYYLEQQKYYTLEALTPAVLARYYTYLKSRSSCRGYGALSKGSLNKHLQALHKFVEYLRQSKQYRLPTLHLAWESCDATAIIPLHPTEIEALYQLSYDTTNELYALRDRAILTIFYGCGLRSNEGYHLNFNDVDLDRRLLHVRKGKANKERFVPFTKVSAKYLEEYMYTARNELLKQSKAAAFFISQRAQRLQAQSMALRLKKLQQRSTTTCLQTKKIHLHLLRHSIATHLLHKGMSLDHISRFLGHSTLESTQLYTHLLSNTYDHI